MFMMRPLMLGTGLLSILRPQDVFTTSLYTGTGASQTITNGLDLLGKGGLVWEKPRSAAGAHTFKDSVRGTALFLVSNTTDAEANSADTPFTNTGFTSRTIPSGTTAAAWSFRRAPKFFDIVTYTGDGTSGRVIPHGLGIAPGMVIVKRRDTADNWPVFHRSLNNASTTVLYLNYTDAAIQQGNAFGSLPTAVGFTVSNLSATNAAGSTYVAYLFAHDPDTTNGIVQCGVYATDGAARGSATLGWRPQWLLLKRADNGSDWYLADTSRGLGGSNVFLLSPNLSSAEQNVGGIITTSATGFSDGGLIAAGGNIIYMAIRAPIT